MTNTTHNPYDETCRVSRLRENLTSGSDGEGLETGRYTVPRQSFTRQTYFHQLKNRLDIENFSARTVESIYQDFYAMLFISNFESVLTIPAQKSLNEKKKASVLDKQVNHSVSYHVIKEYALDLFFSTQSEEILVQKLTRLFQMNPNSKRNRPPSPHNNTSVKASANYRKRIRKITF